MKTILTIWGVGIAYCIYDAIFCTKLAPESKEHLKNRENERKN
jgi:hypothetical protein